MGRKVAGVLSMAAVLWVGSGGVARADTCGEGAYSCDLVVDIDSLYDFGLISEALEEASDEPLTICLEGTRAYEFAGWATPRTDVTICSVDGREFVMPSVQVRFTGEPGTLRVIGPGFETGLAESDYNVELQGAVERVELTDVSILVDPSEALDQRHVVVFSVDAVGARELVLDGVTVDGPTSVFYTSSAATVELDASRGPALTITNPGDEQRPLFRADFAVDLTLKGSLTRTLQSDQKAPPLTGDDFMEATVTLDGLTVEGYDCDPCVQARRIDVRDTIWTLGVDETGTGDPVLIDFALATIVPPGEDRSAAMRGELDELRRVLGGG